MSHLNLETFADNSSSSLTVNNCPYLVNPLNGRVHVTSTAVGGVAQYYCNHGFNLIGDSTGRRYCQIGGRWSGRDPYCQRYPTGILSISMATMQRACWDLQHEIKGYTI